MGKRLSVLTLLSASFVLLAAPSVSEATYRLYFRNGATVDVRSYQEKDGTLIYERFGGTITVPKADVLRIEDSGSSGEAPPSASAPANPGVPRVTRLDRPAGLALQALLDLESVVSVGATYQEYNRRVLDAKIQVDRYLAGGHTSGLFSQAVSVAVASHEIAMEAWQEKIQNRAPVRVAASRLLSSAPANQCMSFLRRLNKAAYPAVGAYPYGWSYRDEWEDILQGAWECASEKTAEAQRALSSP